MTADRLTSLGWEVVGTVRTPVEGLGFETVVLDVTDDAAVASLGRTLMDRWGRLDALVNNAGYGLTGAIEELTPAELRAQLNVNTVAPFALVRALLPALRAASGVVVQVSSVSGFATSDGFGAYNASKFALEGASESLLAEVGDQGVRVVLVEPGPFRTDIAHKSPQAAAKDVDGRYGQMWREIDEWLVWHAADSGDPEECVDAIVAAATRPDAPLRIPVGEGIVEALRARGELFIAQADAAAAFLASLKAE